MLKRELKVNLKSFIIWTSILLMMFLITFLTYPFIISSGSIEMMDEMSKKGFLYKQTEIFKVATTIGEIFEILKGNEDD